MSDKVLKEKPVAGAGVSAYRWITDVNDALRVTQGPRNATEDFVELLNSWGRDYPHRVRMPATTLAVLLNEGGECAVVTDR